MQNIQYHLSIAINAADTARLVPVHCERDIEALVKESEVLTGRPGRKFIVAGAERIAYHVKWNALGLCVRRVQQDSELSDAQFMRAREFNDHTLGAALRCGQLFTLSHYCPVKSRTRSTG
jgi:hypothetical protein